jgi:hypothetical protein
VARVKFFVDRASGEYPDLTDGKVYDVDYEDEVEGVNSYFIFDDEADKEGKDNVEPYPYDASMFDVVDAEIEDGGSKDD